MKHVLLKPTAKSGRSKKEDKNQVAGRRINEAVEGEALEERKPAFYEQKWFWMCLVVIIVCLTRPIKIIICGNGNGCGCDSGNNNGNNNGNHNRLLDRLTE